MGLPSELVAAMLRTLRIKWSLKLVYLSVCLFPLVVAFSLILSLNSAGRLLLSRLYAGIHPWYDMMSLFVFSSLCEPCWIIGLR